MDAQERSRSWPSWISARVCSHSREGRLDSLAAESGLSSGTLIARNSPSLFGLTSKRLSESDTPSTAPRLDFLANGSGCWRRTRRQARWGLRGRRAPAASRRGPFIASTSDRNFPSFTGLLSAQPKKIYSLSGLPSTAAGIFWVCLQHAHILPPRMSVCSTSTPILRSPCRRSRCASLVGHN